MRQYIPQPVPERITYSDGRVVLSPVVVIWEDLSAEAPGYFRAFWAEAPDSTSGSPVIGYCSPGGSHKRIWQVAAEVKRMYPGVQVYRHGRTVPYIRPGSEADKARRGTV